MNPDKMIGDNSVKARNSNKCCRHTKWRLAKEESLAVESFRRWGSRTCIVSKPGYYDDDDNIRRRD